jgi:hypothetical protein
MTLNYLRDNCHKQAVTHIRESQWFKSMYTLQGKTRLTRHTLSTLDSRIVLDHTSLVVCVGNLSLVPTMSKHAPTPEISLGDQKQTGPVVALGHLIPPPMQQPWSRGERFWPSGYTATSTYCAHKLQYVIGTFITCSWGPTHWSLNDIGGGLHP